MAACGARARLNLAYRTDMYVSNRSDTPELPSQLAARTLDAWMASLMAMRRSS